MKKWVLHIIYIVALSFVTSCSTDFVEENALSPSQVNVTFTLALSGQNTGSRATWGEGYNPSEEGDDYDNKIDVNGLQVVMYAAGENNTTNYINKVEQILISHDNANKNIYHFTGSLTIDKAKLKEQIKIMVFANCNTNIESETDLASLEYSYNTNGIPMWGVATYTNLQFLPGKTEDLGTIDMLRAMAKVEVTLGEKLIAENTSLSDVTLDKYNIKGFTLPFGFKTVEITKSLDTENVLNVNSSFTNSSLAFTGNESKISYSIYIPEYKNTGEGFTPAQMKLTLNDKEYTLDFKDYTTGKAFDIIRNHYYQFNIIGVKNGKLDLTIQYQVSDWDDKGNHNIEFN